MKLICVVALGSACLSPFTLTARASAVGLQLNPQEAGTYKSSGRDAHSTGGAYDFYYFGVKKGGASYRVDDGLVKLRSEPGFAAPSDVSVYLSGRRVTVVHYKLAERSAFFEFHANGTFTYLSFGGMLPANMNSGQVGIGSVFSSFHPYLLKYALDRYDAGKRGFQTLPCVDVAKATRRDLQVELFRTRNLAVAGRTFKAKEWRVVAPPNAEAVVWTDEENVPIYWRIPSVEFEVVRRGYESLRVSSPYEGQVSPPTYAAKVEKSVWVPMRDGVRLMADVYRPDAPGKFPVILQRTCYDRSEFGTADGEFYAQRGFVYVTQHVRGRGGSEGDFMPTFHEDVDGFDTLKWCGTQPWSSGKVGMIGASYNGFCAWMAAKTKPKWLKTFVSVVPMPSAPLGANWDGGTFYLSDYLGWLGLLRDRTKVQVYNADITLAMNTLPISKADTVQFGHPVPQYQEFLKHDSFDAAMQSTSYRSSIKNIDLPVMYLDGWLDTVRVATDLNYCEMVARGRKNQKLIWGPWNHFTNRESRSGVVDFSPDGYIDLRTVTLRWFDRWLKGRQNGIDKEPSVDEFILGSNRWIKSNQWPPKAMHPTRWYLQAGGALQPAKPKGQTTSQFVYDPSKLVYSNDANASYLMSMGEDASALCRHTDQLLFDSPVLKKPLRLDGRIRGKLYASTDAKDTDWVMVLIDRHPDGVCVPLANGFIRARYRKSMQHPSLLKPGEIFAYDINLWETGIEIPAGHSVRVIVNSSMFPDTDRNLNTGEPVFSATSMVTAHQKIFHELGRASYVELPVVG